MVAQFVAANTSSINLIVAAGLGLVALVVLILLLRRLRRSDADAQRDALEKHWPEWESHVHSTFLFHGRIEEEMLSAIPLRHRASAMQRYVQTRPSDALIYHPDPPRVELSSPERYKAFLRSWKAAWEMVEDEDAFRAISSSIAKQLCDLMGFTMVDSRAYRHLLGYVVKAPSLRLNVPPRFPIIFLRQREFSPDDVSDLVNFMGILGMTSFFALLIDLNDFPEQMERRKNLRVLVRESIHDFIVLDGQGLRHIMMAKRPEYRLISIILGQVDLTVVSPYVTSGPVPENMFFGRDYELKTIIRKIKDASFALVGGRKIGKTSILSKVYRTLTEKRNHYPLYLDCQPVQDCATFFEAVSAIWDVRLPEPTPHTFRSMVADLVRERRRGIVVILLDEVDALLQYDLEHGETLFRVFRALSQEARCRFVFCGERILNSQLHAPDSPLFNFCDAIHLSYLDRTSARAMITTPMDVMGIALEDVDTIAMRIMDVSSCHPNIIQYICQCLIQAINARSSRVIRLADLDAVTESGTFREFLLEVVWGNATPLEKIISLLMTPRPVTTLEQLNEGFEQLGIQPTRCQLEEATSGLRLYSIAHREGEGYVFDHRMFPKVAGAHLDMPTSLSGLAEEWRQGRSEAGTESNAPGQDGELSKDG